MTRVHVDSGLPYTSRKCKTTVKVQAVITWDLKFVDRHRPYYVWHRHIYRSHRHIMCGRSRLSTTVNFEIGRRGIDSSTAQVHVQETKNTKTTKLKL